jgi:hypothetical protein
MDKLVRYVTVRVHENMTFEIQVELPNDVQDVAAIPRRTSTWSGTLTGYLNCRTTRTISRRTGECYVLTTDVSEKEN